jgi:hypothetical protein
MSELGKLMLSYLEEYFANDELHPDRFYLSPSAYMRARLMNELDRAMEDALMYAETNGGLG